MNDLVSIIVPIYKIEDYIQKCIDSIVGQTYSKLEIILVDDGSPDNCGKICDEYAKKDSRIVVIHKKNGGLSSARNEGLKKATGEYVWFVDGDDYIEKNAVEILINEMRKNKSDILVFNSYNDINGKITTQPFRFINQNITPDRLYIIYTPAAWIKMYKAQLFKNKKFKEGIIYEDLAFMPTLVNDTDKISFIDKPLYYYRIRQGSIMKQNKFNEKIDDKYIALQELKKAFVENNNYDKYLCEIEYLYVKHLLIMYSLEIMKYGRKTYKDKLNKAVSFMNDNFKNWYDNNYIKEEPFRTKLYLWLLKNKCYLIASGMNYIARKVLK